MNSLGNKGITLIEIILAAAVSMTVMLSVAIFLSTGNKSYNEAKKELNLQAESQILMNQICDSILEANYIEDYNLAKQQCVLYQINEDTSLIKDKKILWYDGQANLYCFKEEKATFEPNEECLMARHVKAINIENDGSLVTVSLTLNQGNREYQVENKVRLRNKLVELNS
ncbi:hypothetical protein [Velocimicrobium porci]|uniref:Prepilin-type N-terminal cleavage/methylation domain-containing protein n=1 Tax=Velocimicrobium porci TaxID=2606634 RepID=A0A6L5XWV8_9FIRM|nr:hypothetical protein [Velocimicrobium porci]MSS63099.1 hypothetical protein [Velocimicrobium porci]